MLCGLITHMTSNIHTLSLIYTLLIVLHNKYHHQLCVGLTSNHIALGRLQINFPPQFTKSNFPRYAREISDFINWVGKLICNHPRSHVITSTNPKLCEIHIDVKYEFIWNFPLMWNIAVFTGNFTCDVKYTHTLVELDTPYSFESYWKLLI